MREASIGMVDQRHLRVAADVGIGIDVVFELGGDRQALGLVHTAPGEIAAFARIERTERPSAGHDRSPPAPTPARRHDPRFA
jgi:hypothetical protein